MADFPPAPQTSEIGSRPEGDGKSRPLADGWWLKKGTGMTCSTAALGLSEAAARYERRLAAMAQHQREEQRRREQRALELAHRMDRALTARDVGRAALADQLRRRHEARQRAVAIRRQQLAELEEQQRLAISVRLAAAAHRRDRRLAAVGRTPSASRYAFGSSTPRRLTHLTNLDKRMQTYDVRLRPEKRPARHDEKEDVENKHPMTASAYAAAPVRTTARPTSNMSRSAFTSRSVTSSRHTAVASKKEPKQIPDRSRMSKPTRADAVQTKRTPAASATSRDAVRPPKAVTSRSASAAAAKPPARNRSESRSDKSRRSASVVPNEPTPPAPAPAVVSRPRAVRKQPATTAGAQTRSPPGTPPFEKRTRTEPDAEPDAGQRPAEKEAADAEPLGVRVEPSEDEQRSPSDPKPSDALQIESAEPLPSPELAVVVTEMEQPKQDQESGMSLADELSLLLDAGDTQTDIENQPVDQSTTEQTAASSHPSPSPVPPAPVADDAAYMGDDECQSNRSTGGGARVAKPLHSGNTSDADDREDKEKKLMELAQAEEEKKKMEQALAEKIRLEQEERERRKTRLNAIMARTRGAAAGGQHSPPGAESSSSETEAGRSMPAVSGSSALLSAASAKALQRLSASPAITKLLQKHAKPNADDSRESDDRQSTTTTAGGETELVSDAPTAVHRSKRARTATQKAPAGAESSGAESVLFDVVIDA